MVCTAGAGTVLGALAHGKPLVMLPIASDQHTIAAQVAAAGAGRFRAPGPSSAPELREAFRQVARDPAHAEAARKISVQMHSMPEPEAVIGSLEKLVGA